MIAYDCKFCTPSGKCSHRLAPHPGESSCIEAILATPQENCIGYERKETMQKFWMLLVDGTTTATQRHLGLDGAIKEAQRLLNLPENRGKGVTLLESVNYGKVGTQPPIPICWEHERRLMYSEGEGGGMTILPYSNDFGE